MRVADYIAEYIYDKGIKSVFIVPGGGSMVLTDGLACNAGINVVSCHHEQAAAMAAVGFAKYNGCGCAYVTTGCGGTNTITGVLHAWQDSTACIFISGQVRRSHTVRNSELKLRQIGGQEADIIAIVEPITKYAVMINRLEEVKYHLEKAVYLAKSGRPGPVWLDIPRDIQTAEIDLLKQKCFDEYESEPRPSTGDYQSIISAIRQAKRPVIIAGQGIRLAGVQHCLSDFAHAYGIPVVSPFLGVGSIPTTDSLYIGVIGSRGSRAGNYTVQNSDFILVLGSRLSVGSIGMEFERFAPHALKYVVDIDPIEHAKNTVKIDKLIVSGLKAFFDDLPAFAYDADKSWKEQCLKWKEKYPVCLQEYCEDKDGVNLNYFVSRLSNALNETDVVVSDAGSSFFVTTQTIELKHTSQRYITSGGQAEMGFTLPGAIGACVARGGERVIGITGDGSLQMNLQELQTLVHYKLPVKLFIWNNDGYLSIRSAQRSNFSGRIIGADSTSGISFPSVEKLAACYGIEYVRIEHSSELDDKIPQVLSGDGPTLCEVICQRDQKIIPCVSSKVLENGEIIPMSLEIMFPFLSDDEHNANMISSRRS